MRFQFVPACLIAALFPASLALAQDAPAPKPPEPAGHVFLRGQASLEMVDAAYLGLYTAPIALERGADLNLPPGTGLSVLGVAPDSPAAKAGFQKHDVLTKLGDQLLVNPAQLRVLVRLRKAGESVSFDLMRKGKAQTIKAELASKPMPELTPGGEESMLYGDAIPQGGGGRRAFRMSGEQPLPPEMLKDLPPEIRAELGRMGHGFPPIAPGRLAIQSRVMSNDGTHSIELERGAKNILRIKDKDGKTLYDGPVPADDKAWEAVPAQVRNKAKAMSQCNPAPKQAENDGPTLEGAAKNQVETDGEEPKKVDGKAGQSF